MTWVSGVLLWWTIAIVAATWLAPRRWQPAVVGLLSVAFLVYQAPRSAAVAAFCAVVSFYLVEREPPSGVRVLAAVSLIGGLIVWFKLGVSTDLELGEPLVPLGLSYYGLRAIHYVVERYKGSLEAHSFGQYVTYLIFFPMLLVGPISLFPDFQRDLRRQRWDAALFSRGCERIVYGYAKIVILGNYLISIEMVRWIANTFPTSSALGQYLDCVRFGLNLYFQFSGFSDVAIGIGLLLGFHLMENFRAPYLAPNINEFWRRWHISLTSWCRSYVYLPVAAVTRQPLIGVIVSMIVIGLWHEISLRFLVWGLYHGAGIALWTFASRWRHAVAEAVPSSARGVAQALSIFATFNFVVLGFVFTKEPNLPAAFAVCRSMLGLS